MVSNKNIVNIKVVELINIYSFGFGPFSMSFFFEQFKIWISKYKNYDKIFG
jgi:hypothetical protein